MAKFASPNFLDGGPNYLKATAIRLLLVTDYSAGDSYATVVAKAVATQVMASGDYTNSTPSGTNRRITTATKTPTASANSNQYDNGTATAGSTTTLTNTAKTWTVNGFAGKAVSIISGTGAGQQSRIASNTATILTFAAMTTAPDATSVYRIGDDLHWVFTDNAAEIIYAVPEVTKQAITSGNPVSVPALTYDSLQPV